MDWLRHWQLGEPNFVGIEPRPNDPEFEARYKKWLGPKCRTPVAKADEQAILAEPQR